MICQKCFRRRNCRSFKNFDVTILLKDLENQNLDMSNFDNVSSAYDHFSECFNEVAAKHAHFKERKILPKHVSYMNSELMRAIYRKKIIYNKFQKYTQ